MRNKVLIVGTNAKEKEEMELILQDIVNEGGELFFVEKKEEALSILKKEMPQLVFLDSALVGNEEDWVFDKVHVVVMQDRHAPYHLSEDVIVKPFRRHQVLEKCQQVLPHEPSSPIPPM